MLVESLLSGELRLTADNVNIAVDTLSIHLRLGVLLGDMVRRFAFRLEGVNASLMV